MNPSLFSHPYLLAVWAKEYAAYVEQNDQAVLLRLKHWAEKDFQKETVAQGQFEQTFFSELWGYSLSGAQAKQDGYTLQSQYPIDKAGQGGGQGKADLAAGWFGDAHLPNIPQVLCEFKDVRSGLDAQQKRKGNDRSPVKQCADYLKFACEQHTPYGNEKIQPAWGIVSDMNEFRLYWRTAMPQQYERFVIRDMLAESETARQQRFLFSRLFQREQLLNRGGGSPLLALLGAQRIQEKALEKAFYFEYRAYREHLFKTLLATNPAYRESPRKLVRITQKLLDRFLFILFCEDMGAHLDYPINLLRDILIEASTGASFDPDAPDLWGSKIKRLFACMRDGSPFSGKPINRFNGGLFAEDEALDSLAVPDGIFCAKGQGESNDSLLAHKKTLLYFSTAYNFGIEAGGDRAIGLYTLGRIFEQSITDLEIMEAEATGEVSLMKISKRKTDGVYYTPEWVTAYLVEETLGLRLRELRVEVQQDAPERPDEKQVDDDHSKAGKLKAGTPSKRYFDWQERYIQAISRLTVLDPACGSGAFLIQALKRLLAEHEWIHAEKCRVSYETRQGGLLDLARAYREILANNLYGVDINAESVEITRLALWLHTAMPGKPLSTLDGNIVCGNSLVDGTIEQTMGALTGEQKQRINPFDYPAAFPGVFAAGGFDVVIGNPPYIKLQNMRQIQPEATEYWVKAKTPEGDAKFPSAQTGNFDIYLLFIEQGLRLLKARGRMGFIAPSAWSVNEYGQGLREFLHETRRLDRWVDFKDYQIFDEAITYTALQFFQGRPADGVKLCVASQGSSDLSALDWNALVARPYASLPKAEAWEFMPEDERQLVEKLRRGRKTLAQCSAGIMVGIQTSADSLYHLTRIAPGKYRSYADKANPVEVEIEDALMKPLVSGPEAKRYQSPLTETYLLFPYDLSGGKPGLYPAQTLEEKFPQGWAYLKQHEAALRGRENGKMGKEGWFAYVYPKNLDKQECAKLIVPRLVQNLFCAVDQEASIYLDNVDVGGILPSSSFGLYYLAGVLNAPVCNFIWHRTSKPFQNDYRSANKQFIAPLPIPDASAGQQADVSEKAKTLQALHSQSRDKQAQLTRRLCADAMHDDTEKQSFIWLFGKTVAAAEIRVSAAAKAAGLKGAALTHWACEQAEHALAGKLGALSARLSPRAAFEVTHEAGELALKADGMPVLSAWLDAAEGEFVAAQWRQALRATRITPAMTAKKLVGELLKIKATENSALSKQVIELDRELSAIRFELAAKEREINAAVYALYGLSAEEIARIERG
ncbi:MAG: Eco57I restriction-modification methylase domain-containing protein [Sulfuricellaceae bacterium]|nr:Eco57I restriction-modification methylase domain-containing protein [Sulfuricellaceae bacterium]